MLPSELYLSLIIYHALVIQPSSRRIIFQGWVSAKAEKSRPTLYSILTLVMLLNVKSLIEAI